MSIFATVSANIVYTTGWSEDITITVEDNCCEGHAISKAGNIIKLYVDNAVKEEQQWNPDFDVVSVSTYE